MPTVLSIVCARIVWVTCSCRAYIYSLGYQFVSTLWTPSGEYPLQGNTRPQSREEHRENAPSTDASSPQATSPKAKRRSDGQHGQDEHNIRDRDMALDELQREIAAAPVEVVVANHCYGFFELAAIHLSKQPPDAEAARLAIDAMGAVLDGLGQRLGEHFAALEEGLAQIRLAYVTIVGKQKETASENGDGPPKV